MVRIGLVGTENSHAREIVHHLNARPISDAARIVALVGADDEHNRALASVGGITQLVPTSIELIGSIDALIVTNRDGARHREHAVPFLDAGVPVWVDKPLAASTADARAILEAANRTRTPVTSYSAIRWVADAETLAQGTKTVGDLQAVTVTGPADPASEYSGIFFYGIHSADLAQRLAPGDPGPVDVEQVGDTVIARYRSNGVLVTLRLVKPTGQVPFHAEIVGSAGIVSHDVRLDTNYVVPGLKVFLDLLATGHAPLDDATMLAPITVLEQISNQLS